MSYEESVRVVRDLNLVSSKGRVTDIVVNQVLGDGSADVFWSRKVKSSKKQIELLKEEINGHANVVTVPYIDTEITGGAGLSYLGNMHFEEGSFSGDFFEGPGENYQTRVTVFGGKGGVGKTTTSSTVAIKLMKLGERGPGQHFVRPICVVRTADVVLTRLLISRLPTTTTTLF